MIGLKRGTVKLCLHHDEWAQLFEIEKKLLVKTLGDHIIAIEHVGSTSIHGVSSKPIIDIRVAISSLDDSDIKMIDKLLTGLGYFCMHKFTDRIFYAKGPEENRTHHISLEKVGSEVGWKDCLLFRDYLRMHKDRRNEYAALKMNLAEKFAEDRKSYTAAKEEFIQDIIKLAAAEKKIN